MPDYREMYLKLFRETTKAIAILQKVQQDTEEMYISSQLPEISIYEPEEEQECTG